MFRTILAVAAYALFFTACAPAEATQPDGEWSYSDGDFEMAAQIINGEIEINFVSDNSTDLYWIGTFQSTELNDGDEVVSEGYTDQMDAALLASTDDTKTFTYTDNKLTYEFTMTGNTRTIELEQER